MTGRAASAALLPLAEAIGLLTAVLAPVAPVARALDAAVGTVAAGDVRAPADSPGRLTALRDGWAVSAAAITGASPYSPLPLVRPLAWVEAGAAMPEGTDTVLPPEAFEDGTVVADAPARDGTRAIGGEVGAGERLVAAGERLTALHALALAAAGLDRVAVRVPRVRLVVTGAAEGTTDALSSTLAALIAAWGAEVSEVAGVPDEVDVIAGAIGAGGGDAVLVLGGTGFGRTDRSAAALAGAGSVHAHGLALRPGETAAIGEAAGRPVLLLPGRPEAALAVLLALGRPLLGALAGLVEPPRARAPLLRKVSSTIGLSEVVFVRRAAAGIEPLGGVEIPLQRLGQATGAVLVPPEREGYPEGTEVEIMAL